MHNLASIGCFALFTVTVICDRGVAQPALEAYGAPTAGTGGKKPFLWATAAARPGEARYGLTIDNGKPGAAAVAFFSQQRASVNVGGVSVLINFATSTQLPFVTLDSKGSAVYKLPFPNIASLIGLTGVHQAYIADSGGAPLGFSATQGLQVRVARSSLLVTSSMRAVDLASGRMVSIAPTGVKFGTFVDFNPQGATHCLISQQSSKRVQLYDCRTFPPKAGVFYAGQTLPWSTTFHPDGLRAYTVNQGPQNSKPIVQVVWAKPGIQNFGKAFPGKVIQMGSIIDGMHFVFFKKGTIGIQGTLGLFGSKGCQLRKFDVKSGSTTYHNEIGNYNVIGNFMFEFCKVNDDLLAMSSAPLGATTSIRLIDVNTMKVTAQFGPKGFAPVVDAMVAGPRGRYLYVGNKPHSKGSVAGVVRINIDKSDPGFGKMVNINAGMNQFWGVKALALSPAGDRLYAVTDGDTFEYDPETGKALRRWKTNGNRVAVR